mgnify:FL=1|tara:strand:- start:265 stop:645 length:381 start_codon:yes stop_codon:yes gene_type:complete
MNITKITKNNKVILKNKDNNTIYRVDKINSLVTFKGHDYNIDDNATARNLIYMLIDKCAQDDDLIDDYRTVLKNKEEAIRLLEKDIKKYNNNLSKYIDDKIKIEKEKNKIEDSIKIFFRLNEKIIK